MPRKIYIYRKELGVPLVSGTVKHVVKMTNAASLHTLRVGWRDGGFGGEGS